METRRDLLRRLALGLGVIAAGGASANTAAEATYVGIETSPKGLSRARFFSETGAAIGQTPLDFRAHGLAEQDGRLVVFPRRPGNTFAVLDTQTLNIRTVVTAPSGRHFFGHGAFSRDGKTLLVAENNLTTLAGSIAHYDVAGPIKRLGSLPLPGPGPHEITRAPQADLFAIALGGFETHPDYGRDPLNLHDFRSQVLLYDLLQGDLMPLGYWPGSEGISLRHLAFDGVGRLYVGGQVPERSSGVGSAVLWLVEGNAATALDASAVMGGYVSSVAADQSCALISSKVTGQVITLDGTQLIDRMTIDGASAVAVKGGFTARAGFSVLRLKGGDVPSVLPHEFDNHGIMY